MIEKFIEPANSIKSDALLTEDDKTALLKNTYRMGINRFKKFLERMADYQDPYIKDEAYEAVSLQIKDDEILTTWGLPPDANVQIVLGYTPDLFDEDKDLIDCTCEIAVVHHDQDGGQNLIKLLPLRQYEGDENNFDLVNDPQTIDQALVAQKVLLGMMGDQVEMLHFIERNVISSEEAQ